MQEKILTLLEEIKTLLASDTISSAMPCNTFYLNDSEILCLDRQEGESRFPYEMDGLNLWIHSTGYINACESNFVIFRTAMQQEETSVEFWGGLKNGEEYIPISVTGATKPVKEPVPLARYTVFGKRAAYYITETEDVVFTLRCNITSKKQIRFVLSAISKSDKEQEIYLTSYISPLLRFTDVEDGWLYWNRYGYLYPDGSFKIMRRHSPEGMDVVDLDNFAVINKRIEGSPVRVESTVSKAVFLGQNGRCLSNTTTLTQGTYIKQGVAVSNSSTLAAASDIITFPLQPGQMVYVDYVMDVFHNEEEADKCLGNPVDTAALEQDIAEQEAAEDRRMGLLNIAFGDMKDNRVNSEVFNHFIKSLQKQVTFCALGKNYVGELLGVRDVFQQLTATTIWNKDDVREKIVKALNFIMDNGRPPRQFSVPPQEDIIPKFDIRQFIDQGLWIVETLHKYISSTADLSILDEQCSYYVIIDETKGQYKKSNCVDSVLDHLLKITNFLVSKIDAETGCLRILYGDWNDSLNGLGHSIDGKEEFGTGVSVMATLQLYKTLQEMIEILHMVGGYEETCETYASIRESLARGLETYAVEQEGDRTHLVHGWGDKRSYKVGSLMDTDGTKRFSVNPYSFWCICDMIARDTSMKESILKAYDALDSKYGIKTFEPGFKRDMKGVGRISVLTMGTHENGATYIHATLFAVMALFMIGEPERAWEQIFKCIPITHERLTKSPFVMPNCYFCNQEYNLDGESAGDWYTGSGAVLIRCIFEHALGFQAKPEGLRISVPGYMPSDTVSMETIFKGSHICFRYQNTNGAKRVYLVNGVEQETTIDPVSGDPVLFLPNDKITPCMDIEVID